MQISIGIAAYNEEKHLPRLLKDLCAQDYPKNEIELIFADGCSSDATRSKLCAGGKRLQAHIDIGE